MCLTRCALWTLLKHKTDTYLDKIDTYLGNLISLSLSFSSVEMISDLIFESFKKHMYL